MIADVSAGRRVARRRDPSANQPTRSASPLADPEGTAAAISGGGSSTQKIAPRGTAAVVQRRPPCASTIERLIASPIPIPLVLVVKNGSKTRPSPPRATPAPP